jgi:hypothetical protein
MNATLETVKPIANELNEPSHTPGPWRADQWANGWSIGAPKAGLTVCVLNDCRNAELNARLIASAPELLYALESACGCIEAGLDDVPSDAREAMENDLNVYRAAIAKAKGEIYTPVF